MSYLSSIADSNKIIVFRYKLLDFKSMNIADLYGETLIASLLDRVSE